MKRILFIATAFPESEADFKGIFIRDYLLSIKDEFHCSIFVFRMCSSKNGFVVENTPSYTVYRYAWFSQSIARIFKWLFYPVFLIFTFNQLKKIPRPDIIHVHGALLIGGIIGLIFGRQKKIPVIYTEHLGRFEHFYQNRFRRLTARSILLKFDHITCVSSYIRSKITAIGIPEPRITVINNPVDTNLFIINPEIVKGSSIAFVGRLDENKGIIRCLMAFKKLVNKYQHYKLLIIGDGNQRLLVENILKQDHILKTHVTIHGLLEKKIIAQILQSCRFLVAPSLIESFGIAVAEAMACGLPVIVGKNNGTSEFVDEEVGLIIDSSRIAQLSDAMEWLILYHKGYDPLKIRARITDNFCFEVTRKKLSGLYNSVSKV